MTSALQLVRERFPQLRERVAELFDGDEVFRELCEDYEVCVLAVAGRASGEEIQREYAALRLRLETELLRHVSEAEPSRRRT